MIHTYHSQHRLRSTAHPYFPTPTPRAAYGGTSSHLFAARALYPGTLAVYTTPSPTCQRPLLSPSSLPVQGHPRRCPLWRSACWVPSTTALASHRRARPLRQALLGATSPPASMRDN